MRLAGLVIALSGAWPAMAAATPRAVRPCPECMESRGANVTREVIVRRAERALRAGEWNESAELWRDALLMDGRDGAEWMTFGDVLSRAERHREAVAAYQRAIQIDSRLSRDATRRVARAYVQMGNDRQAVRWLEQALLHGVSPAELWKEDAFARFKYDRRLRGEQPRQVDRLGPRGPGAVRRSI